MDSILVVDDEADLVRTYERLLRRRGLRVVSAGSRQAASSSSSASRSRCSSPTSVSPMATDWIWSVRRVGRPRRRRRSS
jgi:hypothetical protein